MCPTHIIARFFKPGPGILLPGLLILAILAAALLQRAAAPLASQGLSDWLLSHKQRRLQIDGEPILHLWPEPSLELPRTTLSEAGSPEIFARLSAARIHWQWLPLLERRLVIDRMEIRDIQTTLSRDAHGHLNIADFLETGEPTRFDTEIRHLELSRAEILWRDATTGREIHLDKLDLRCDKPAPASPGDCHLKGQAGIPGDSAWRGQFTLEARYRINQTRQQYGLENPRIHFTSPAGLDIRMNAARLDAALQPGLHVRATQAHLLAKYRPENTHPQADLALDIPTALLTTQRLNAERISLAAEAHPKTGPLRANLSSSLEMDIALKTLALPDLQGKIELSHPRLKPAILPLTLRGKITSNLSNQESAGEFTGHLPDSPLKGSFHLKLSPPPAALAFKLDIDHLDADRLLQAAAKNSPGPTEQDIASQPPEGLDLQGQLNIGILKLSGLSARKTRLDIKLRPEETEIR